MYRSWVGQVELDKMHSSALTELSLERKENDSLIGIVLGAGPPFDANGGHDFKL